MRDLNIPAQHLRELCTQLLFALLAIGVGNTLLSVTLVNRQGIEALWIFVKRDELTVILPNDFGKSRRKILLWAA